MIAIGLEMKMIGKVSVDLFFMGNITFTYLDVKKAIDIHFFNL